MALPLGLRGAVALIVAIAAGGCATSSNSGVPNVHTVIPGVLVRGGQPNEGGFRRLRDTYGVAAVVNLNDQTVHSERAMVEACGMTYVPLPSNAFKPDADKVLTFLRAVEESKHKGAVYVHCKHGMDRTGLAVAAYRIAVQGWDADRALAELRRYQAFSHELVFKNLHQYVRGIGRDRDQWSERVAAFAVPAVGEDAQVADAGG
jgi:tyrosine-protein phosphatase SIW14